MSSKGSEKCLLNLVKSSSFIGEINSLIKPYANICDNDKWIPNKSKRNEVELSSFLRIHFDGNLDEKMKRWWLADGIKIGRKPTWDLISTCTIKNKKGILLVEAKAHNDELKKEKLGKKLDKENSSEGTKKNHKSITEAIKDARKEINKSFPDVSISVDNCYQLSNRIAHAYWLADNDIPVVLLYLGFLNAEDMNNGKYKLFKSNEDWEISFLNHASLIGVDSIIDKKVNCGKSTFVTVSKSLECENRGNRLTNKKN